MDTINLNSPQAEQQLRDSNIPPLPRNTTTDKPATGVPAQPRKPQTAGNDAGKKVATVLGAAALGGGATAATMATLDSDGEITLDDQIIEAASQTATAIGQPQPAQPANNGGGQTPGSPTVNIPEPEPEPAPVPDPEPIPDPIPDPEPEPDPIPETEPTPEPEPLTDIEDPEDIDEIADTIIAQNQIDPDDIDDPDIFTFNGVETVYTVDGDEETHASFTSNTGYDLVMIDIDNDGLFDKIETPDGTFVDDASQFGLTVSDAENKVQGEGYIAQNEAEIEHFDESLGDDYLDDIIEV